MTDCQLIGLITSAPVRIVLLVGAIGVNVFRLLTDRQNPDTGND